MSREGIHWFGTSASERSASSCLISERIRTDNYLRVIPGAELSLDGVYPTVFGKVKGELIAIIQGVAPSYLRDAVHYSREYLHASRMVFLGTGGALSGAVGDFVLPESACLIDELGRTVGSQAPSWSRAELERAASAVQGLLGAERARALVGRAATVPGVSWETRSRLVNLRADGVELVTLDTFHFFAACQSAGLAGLACQWVTDEPLTGKFVWSDDSGVAVELSVARNRAWALVPEVALKLLEFVGD